MADTLPADTTSLAIASLAPAPISSADPVAAWNTANPVGAWVIAYPGARGHRYLITQTQTAAFLTSSGSPAVFLKGHASYIALTHVDPITAAKAGELQELRHQVYELDRDSKYSIEGACCRSCLPGGQS